MPSGTLERPADYRTVKPLCAPRLPEGPARQAGPTQEKSLHRASQTFISGTAWPEADNQNGASRRNQATCQMESRSWGNLTRWAGSMGPPVTGQITSRPGYPVLHPAKQRLSGEMKGTPPERSHAPTAAHGPALSVSNHTAAARCRGNLPVGSLSFGAPASTFHSDTHPLLLLASRIVALRERNAD